MDTNRGGWSVGRIGVALGVGGLLALSACGGGAQEPHASVAPAAAGETAAAFGEVVAAVERTGVALCPPAEGGAYIPLPAPPPEAAAAASYFRYQEGRIYQFGPCQVPANQRNELRLFRYGARETRDA